jgi:phosphoglycerol transferase MdoB-like AlkP superfamily enzyme
MAIKIITWVIICYGFTNIVVYGSIFEFIREFFRKLSEKSIKIVNLIHELITCPMCFSTWVGFFMGGIIWSPVYHLFDVSLMYSWFFDGVLASGAVWAINSFIEFFEESRIK